MTKTNLVIPSSLMRLHNNDYHTVSDTGFYYHSTFYQMNDKIIDTFQIIFTDLNHNIIKIKINYVGNLNVYFIKDEMNALLDDKMSVTGDRFFYL